MKFGIDAFGCDHGRSGIGSYLHSLVSNLPSDPHLQFELFGPEVDRYTYTSSRRDMEYRSSHAFGGTLDSRLWHQLKAAGVIKRFKYDVVLFPSASRFLPPVFRVPGVAVISDVLSSILKTSGEFWLHRQIRQRLSKVARIITPSQYVKKDLVNLGFDPSKIEVVFHGIDHSQFFPRNAPGEDEEMECIKPFAIKRPYLIYASRIQGEAKKHRELIQAFNRFKAMTGLPHRLALVGSNSNASKALLREIVESPFVRDILLTGYFPHESLPLLYAYADGCVFPASSEGVGLPVIEAMASGIPAACARAGALPEIAGTHAVLFDPDSLEDSAGALEKLITDKPLRDKLITDGAEWTKRYTWKQTAEETVGILKKMVEK
jgi:glycosyltransferase involved in cell wall biosynthesis